jgi:uncharacterized membrane protein YjgN (DUF898 family)
MDMAIASNDRSAQSAPSVPVPAVTRHPIEFSASAGEYFRIWIVNVMLSVLTLGIYSAWATVRTRRYFYANTRLDGEPFEYLAEPLQILTGRLIAIALLGSYLLLNQFAPMWSLAVLVLITLLTPWLVYSALRFRARYSSWRGLRFQFTGTLGQSVSRFLGLPLLIIPSLGLAYPWIKGLQHEYVATGHRFGGKRFEFTRNGGRYYAIYIAGAGIIIGAVIGGAIVMGAGAISPEAGTIGTVLGMTLIYAGYLIGFVYIAVRLANLFWTSLALDGHRFESNLQARDLAWIYFSNTLAIIVSLGLLIPWAVVRAARYRASRLAFLASGSLDVFVAEAGAEQSATGAEIGDAFDFEFDAGL